LRPPQPSLNKPEQAVLMNDPDDVEAPLKNATEELPKTGLAAVQT